MAGPLDWLLPGPDPTARRDPMAWLMAQQNQPVGLVPPDESGPAEDHWTPDAASPHAPTQPQAQSAAPGEPTQSVNRMPGGAWGNWMQEPGNREFFLSTVLSLVNGANPGAALGAGFNAQSAAQEQALIPAEVEAGTRRSGPGVSRRRRGGPYVGHPAWREARGSGLEARAAAGVPPVGAQAEVGGASEEELEPPLMGSEANLIPAVAPGSREALLHRVQDRRRVQQAQLPGGDIGPTPRGSRMPPSGARSDARGTPSGADMVEMLTSRDPAARVEGQAWARRLWGSPGVGFEWGIDENGNRTRQSIGPQGGGRPAAQGRFQAASQAGVQSARLDINSIRDYIDNQLPLLGQAERTASLTSQVGPYANLVNNMRNAVASYMHARSGAQTSVAEFRHYVDTFLPKANELHYTTQAKLSNLELQVMLIGRLSGEPIDVNELFQKYNEARAWNGVRPIAREEFERILPGLERESQARLPSRLNNPAAGTSVAPRPLTPPTPGGAGPGQPPAETPAGTPVDVRTPEEAQRLEPGTEYRTPDGTIYRR